MRTKGTYLRSNHQIFFAFPFEYTKKQKQKILSYFPKDKKIGTLRETITVVKRLVSWLLSEETPKCINRNRSKEEINSLLKSLTKLKKKMALGAIPDFKPNDMVKVGNDTAKIIRTEGKNVILSIAGKEVVKEIADLTKDSNKNNFVLSELRAQCIQKGIALDEFKECLCCLELICKEMLYLKQRPGRQNEAKYQCCQELLKVWEKYNKEMATRKVTVNGGIIYSKAYNYLYASIAPAIENINKTFGF